MLRPARKLLMMLACLTLAAMAFPVGVSAQSAVFSDLSAGHKFGESFTFNAVLSLNDPVTSVSLTFRQQIDGTSIVLDADPDAAGHISVEYQIEAKDHFAPFARIEYWFTAKMADGTQVESETQVFAYEDNRYTWQTLNNSDGFAVYWVEGELALGQAVKDAIYQHLDNYSQYLDLPIPEQLTIYIYPTHSALQSALDVTNARWVAGHADPAQNTILVAIPTGFDQSLDIRRQIPHEITHIRLYLAMRENYTNLPVWYSEGLASLAEQSTSTEYGPILEAGRENGELIPLEDLCQTFPTSTRDVALAYAESESFTRYLFNTYGKIGLESLLAAYTSGHTCGNGVLTAFDANLQTLETNWQEEVFRASILSEANIQAASWIVLVVLVLAIPLSSVIIQWMRSRPVKKE